MLQHITITDRKSQSKCGTSEIFGPSGTVLHGDTLRSKGEVLLVRWVRRMVMALWGDLVRI